MVSYDHYRRSKAKVEVLRGYDPNEPTNLRVSAPVAANQGIKSGMFISLWWNAARSRNEWVKGVDVTTLSQDKNVQVFVALQDEDEHDVVNCGQLTGLSCSGEFEIQTAYFKAGDTYNESIPLTYDAATGSAKAATYDAETPIIGIVSRQHGLVDVAPYNSGVTRDAQGKVLVLQFVTKFLPARAAA